MTLKEATVYQEAICAGLHETGKDSPYRDDMIPKMKESCELAIRSLEAWEKIANEINDGRSQFWVCGPVADDGIDFALEVINKHLSEAEGENERQ